MRSCLFLLSLLVFPSWGAAATTNDIIRKMIEAHGGMAPWEKAHTVSFHTESSFHGSNDIIRSRAMIQQKSRRAVHWFPDLKTKSGWDGERAWYEGQALPFPPRFYALLDYHFLMMPWLTQDKGVILGEPKKGKLWDDPTEYIAIRMTFEKGARDTDKDYYILFIDPKTYRLKGCEYIITYSGILPPGVEKTPPHYIIFEDLKNVEGLLVPSRYTIYQQNKVPNSSCTLSNWSFKNKLDDAKLVPGLTAVLDPTQP